MQGDWAAVCNKHPAGRLSYYPDLPSGGQHIRAKGTASLQRGHGGYEEDA